GHRRARAARAGRARAWGIGPGSHPRLRALQLDRRLIDRRRRARGGRARPVGVPRGGQDRRPAGDVLRLCPARARRSAGFLPSPPRPDQGTGAARHRSGPLAPNRLQARRALQPGFVCRRLHRSIAHGALAVRAFRSLARRSERVLLLVERAHGLLLSGGGAAGRALRPRQHHGVHAYPLERLSHPCSLLAQSYRRAHAATRALRTLADGRADAHVLRHGGGGPCGAGGGRARDRGPAQPRHGGQAGRVRRPGVDVVCGIAARRLRRVEDRLRPLALVFVSTHQAAGGEGSDALKFRADSDLQLSVPAREGAMRSHDHGKRCRRLKADGDAEYARCADQTPHPRSQFTGREPMQTISVLLVLGLGAVAMTTPAIGGYRLLQTIAIAGDDGWDHPTVDSDARRLYVTHGTHVVVIDVDSAKLVGKIDDTPGVHFTVIDPELDRGFISNGGAARLTIFNANTLETMGQVKSTGENPGPTVFDPATKRVFIFNLNSHNATVVDSKEGNVVGAFELGGRPE